jgi:DNA replication protein DnaC
MITEDRYKNEIILEFVTKMFDVEKSFIKKRADEIRLKTSSFPVVKTLEEFDFSFQPSVNRNTIEMLKTMDFVDKHRNLVLLGTPGVGKTHIAIALGIIATQSKRSTYFIDALTLITKLKEAQNHNRLDEQLKQYAKYKLLVIDELGYLPIDVAGANLLFRLINLKYEKSSIIITTNKNFNE